MAIDKHIFFLVHQIGAGSDGGLTSIGEILAYAPMTNKKVITNLASEFSRSWEKRSIHVDVWLMAEDGYGEDMRPMARLIRRFVNNLRMFFAVLRSKVKVVHINDHRALWNGAFGAKLAGARVIFNVRDGMREGASRNRWRFFLRLCDCFLTLSQEMETHWKGKLGPLSPEEENKFRHLYSIVDRGRFYPATGGLREALRERLGIEPNCLALLYVGRFDEKKAQLAFICEAAPLICHQRSDVIIYFVGDFHPETDSYARACRQAVADLRLISQVRFVGYSADVADWYRAADLLLLASLREGLARCMIEGIACGTPMVSFDVCSAYEILEGYGCGLVAPLRNYPAFARAVLKLSDDGSMRKYMEERGPQVAGELFDPVRNALAYTTLVGELAS